MKKGRHRRYEEARALKRTSDGFDDYLGSNEEPCVECGEMPGNCKPWCVLEEAAVMYDDDPQSLFPS